MTTIEHLEQICTTLNIDTTALPDRLLTTYLSAITSALGGGSAEEDLEWSEYSPTNYNEFRLDSLESGTYKVKLELMDGSTVIANENLLYNHDDINANQTVTFNIDIDVCIIDFCHTYIEGMPDSPPDADWVSVTISAPTGAMTLYLAKLD